MKNDIKKNGSGYYDPTAFKAIINTGGVNNMEVYKGDIFYIEKGKTEEKSPAVVVSATEVIEETGCAQVAWLTNKEENSSSTHVKVMCMTPSVAICEKLSFAYLDRFGEYIRTCTEKEIQDIDNAMLATLGIERQNDNADCEEIRTLKKELEEKQREIEEMKASAREKETEEKEPDDQMEETANRLQHEVSTKCSRELEKGPEVPGRLYTGNRGLLKIHKRGTERIMPKEFRKRLKHWIMKARKKNHSHCCIFCERWQMCKYEEYKKREDSQRKFVRARDVLKAESKKTWLYKTIIRLLDWMAEKIK